MHTRTKYSTFFICLIAFGVALFSSAEVAAQRNFKGRVIYKRDARPAPMATVSVLRHPRASVTDDAGNFDIFVTGNDTLLISSVGYESILIPVNEALRRPEFALQEKSRNLAPVTVRFRSEGTAGSSKENVGYFRSWNYERTGGEMGRIFTLPYKAFVLDKIRFKVSNTCNACLLRLRIRKVVDGVPGDEILTDSVSVSVNGMKLDDKALEFDLSKYELVFNQREIFVGIEAISCDHAGKDGCSFLFAGTEPGMYTYKSRTDSDWETTDAFSMYLKLFLRY